MGLAPFLRMSIAGADFLHVGQEMLAKAEHDSGDANQLMNLSTVMLCLGQRDLGLMIQDQALELNRVYHLAATVQPAKFRLLMLMVQGDLSANTPLDCLLENSDIDLDYYYVLPNTPLIAAIPEHDAVIVCIGESDENRDILNSLQQALAHWPKPVINAPQYIPATGRDAASVLLQDIPGLLIPLTLYAPRTTLQDIAEGQAGISELLGQCDFPFIVRPVDSQAGRDLDKINRPEDMASYLAKVNRAEFFLSRFVDYSGKDGLFRKIRIALIDGEAFACHMAVSSNWMVHYVNANMYEDAQKRHEEICFMEHFADFAYRHQSALEVVHQRTKLDYLCIDCAETRDGQLLVFEIDHAMVVHAMDPEHMFSYKQLHMQKVKNAFRDFLFRKVSMGSHDAVQCAP